MLQSSKRTSLALLYALLTLYTPSTTAAAAATTTTTNPPPAFLNFTSPSPHIFSSLHSLSQQWPNTFFPNGHTISPCSIPAHTLFYHGRHDNTSPPPSPEWLAFDIEMSYGIMGSMRDSRMLTYRTTRAVQCVYFDGMSASLMGSGTESQMVFLYGDSDSVPKSPWDRRPPGGGNGGGHGKPPPPDDPSPPKDGQPPGGKRPDWGGWNPLKDEYFRARGLCDWLREQGLGGRGWGYEGIVRMNAGFELIWCDFASDSLQLVSNLNVSVPRLAGDQSIGDGVGGRVERLLGAAGAATNLRRDQIVLKNEDEGPHGPGMTDPTEPFRGVANWMWFAAATKRYGSTGSRGVGPGRGESRMRIDTCGLFSFYDPDLLDQSIARAESDRSSLNISSTGFWRAPEDERYRDVALEALMRRRRAYRTDHISKKDGEFMRQAVGQGLQASLDHARGKSNVTCSGVDWHLTAREIVTFYSTGLRELLELLRRTDETEASWLEARDWLESVRIITHWFMLPFTEYPQGPWTDESLKDDYSIDSPAAKAALSRCQEQYAIGDVDRLSNAERTLSLATQETLAGICRSVFEVGLAVEYEWLSHFNMIPETNQKASSPELPDLSIANVWRKRIEELMAWLGWAEQWTGCSGPCALDELCYIPMWPVGGWPGRRRSSQDSPKEPGRSGPPRWGDIDKYLWEPTCVNASSYPP